MIIFSRYAGIGDSLFVSTFATQWALENKQKVFVAAKYPEIFKHNPNLILLPFYKNKSLRRFRRILTWLGIKHEFKYLDYGNPEEKHIFDILQSKTAVKNVPERPIIFLSQKEKQQTLIDKSDNRKIIAIQSIGVAGWTNNKNYYPDRFQAVVKELNTFFRFVQVGQKDDPYLEGCEDWRGKTSIRESFILLNQVDLFLGQVGFLMHAANAVNTPGVIIYGGFEAPWQSGYQENTNLFTQLECSPCWRVDCPYNKKCMDLITVEMVIEAVQNKLKNC